MAESFQEVGWLALTGGAHGGEDSAAGEPLAPGQAVGAQLMRGDLSLTATGTVTAVEAGRVWAFGHPLVQAGVTLLPMTRVEIIATIPSDLNSYRLGNVGRTVGAFHQDRYSGIAGYLGDGPELVPIRIRLQSEGFPARDLRYEVVDHPAWSPFLAQVALLNSILGDISFGEELTLTVSSKVELAGHPPVKLRETYTQVGAAAGPTISAAGDLGRLVSSLLANRFETPRVLGMEIDVALESRRRYAVVEEIRSSRRTVRPGETFDLWAVLLPFRGPREVVRMSLRIPEDLSPGPLHVMMGSAAAAEGLERRATASRLRQLDSLPAVIGWINDLRSSDRLYVNSRRQGESTGTC